MNDDLISRAAVLGYIDSMPCEVTADGHYMIRRVRLTEYIADTLPSAQPEPLTINFAQELDIETIEKVKESMKNAPVLIMAVNDDSAEPERKKGRWITKSTNGEMFDVCSACGYVEWDTPRNFCPNCGADMRGEEG